MQVTPPDHRHDIIMNILLIKANILAKVPDATFLKLIGKQMLNG